MTLTGMQLDSPVIIGCVGGSGSRVLQQILSQAGYFMGNNLNASCDAMDFEPFLDESIGPILTQTRSVNYDPDIDISKDSPIYRFRLRALIEKHMALIPDGAAGWGWKCPRNLYILPLIHALYPKMRFIHIVRDGRDMTLSWNQHQVKNYYEYFFGPATRGPNPVYVMQFWEKVNLGASDWATMMLANRYHWLRYEDICEQPEETVRGIADFLGEQWDVPSIAKLVVPSESIARYKDFSEAQQGALEKVGNTALRHYKYVA